jgi:hypothetical protein
MADNGEAELLAIVQNTAPVQCAGAISVLNHYYGRDAVPIAAYNVFTHGATLQMEDPLPYGMFGQFARAVQCSRDECLIEIGIALSYSA